MASRKHVMSALEATSLINKWLEEDVDESESEIESSESDEDCENEASLSNNNVPDKGTSVNSQTTETELPLVDEDLLEEINDDNSVEGLQDPEEPLEEIPAKKSKLKAVVKEDSWTLLDTDDTDECVHHFPFAPSATPGIISKNINVESSPIECLFEFLLWKLN